MGENKKLPPNVFYLNLGLEYFTKGIIGFGRQFNEFLPTCTGITVRIKLEGHANEIEGFFTRGGLTKINGKNELIDWFKKNFELGDKVLVQIITPTKYNLSKP